MRHWTQADEENATHNTVNVHLWKQCETMTVIRFLAPRSFWWSKLQSSCLEHEVSCSSKITESHWDELWLFQLHCYHVSQNDLCTYFTFLLQEVVEMILTADQENQFWKRELKDNKALIQSCLQMSSDMSFSTWIMCSWIISAAIFTNYSTNKVQNSKHTFDLNHKQEGSRKLWEESSW